MFVGTANATTLSSYDYNEYNINSRCDALQFAEMQGQTVVDSCKKCFFEKDGIVDTSKFRIKSEITFDTVRHTCSPDPEEIEYIERELDCVNALNFNVIPEACFNCMHGSQNQYEQIGEGIAFKIWKRQLNKYECDIFNEIAIGCAAGWYGQPQSSHDVELAGCTKCPGEGTSSSWSSYLSNCYIPSGKKITDSTGTYVYSSNCYYSK